MVRVALQSLHRAKNAVFLVSAFLLGVLAKGSGLIDDIRRHWGTALALTGEHLLLLFFSGGLAVVMGVAAGILLSRMRLERATVVIGEVLVVAVVLPVLAVLAIAVLLFGKDVWAAVFALWLISFVPLVRYTRNALRMVPVYLREAAMGLGMQPWQVLWRIELPSALFDIIAGVRRILVINAGCVPLVFLIGGGGLGELIFNGIERNDRGMLLAGGIMAALLALIVDFVIGQAAFWLMPRGMRSNSWLPTGQQ